MRRGLGQEATVVRTGYGRPRARKQADWLGEAAFGMLAVGGTGAGLTADARPGDLVVGTEVTGGSAAVTSPSAPLLAGELRRAGLRVRRGPVVTVDQLVRRGIGGVAAQGALAVDMESAHRCWPRRRAPGGVVRAISDTPRARAARSRHGRYRRAAVAAARPRRCSTAGRRPAAAPEVRAGRPALVLRRGRAGHRDRRARARAARRPGLRAQADRAQHDVVDGLELAAGRHLRGRARARSRTAPPSCSPRTGSRPRCVARLGRRDLRTVDATCPLVSKVHVEARRFAPRATRSR